MTEIENDDEFLHRQLCPDGACVGLLDSQRVCKECGLVDSDATADPRLRGLKHEPIEPEAAVQTPATINDDTHDIDDDVQDADDDAPEDFADRRLCPDGACIGVVGSDGLCGECGAVA